MKLSQIFNKYAWERQIDKVRYFFNPRQKWLTKAIPKHWSDKDYLIQTCLFTMLIHFVEVENGLESIYGPHYEEFSEFYDEEQIAAHKKINQERKIIRAEIEAAYNYVKTQRPELEKELSEAYPKPLNGKGWLDDMIPVKNDKGEVYAHQVRSVEEIYGVPYNIAYAEVNRIEALMEKTDTEAMITLVKYRGHLWT